MTQSCGVNKVANRLANKIAIVYFLLFGTLTANAGPVPVTGDYRSTAAGNLDSPGIWEQLTIGGWAAISGAPDLTSGTVFIYHSVTALNAFTGTNLTIGTGGTLSVSGIGTVNNQLLVQQGGILQINNQLSLAMAAQFAADNGSTVALNYAYATPEATIWNGVENFGPSSALIIRNWNTATPILNTPTAMTENAVNGFSAVFGNLILDFGATQMQGLRVMSSTFSKNIAHGSVTITAAGSGSSITLGGSASTINGNLVTNTGFSGSTLSLATSQLTINGSLQQHSGLLYAANASGIVATLTVKGNMQLTGGTFDLLPGTLPTGSGTTVNLAGNLEVQPAATLTNSNTSAADAARVAFNFNGTTPQNAQVALLVANVPFRVLSGARVVLGANLKVNRSTIATIIQTGGTLDFNGFNFEGTSGFTQMAQATLRITSPLGLDTDGNVQSSVNGRKFDKDGIYHFAGTVPQITGSGLNPASGQKTIIVDNPTSVTFSQPVSISTTGGAIDIRQGTLQETETGFVNITNSSNSVQLKMAANTAYRTATLAASLSVSHNSVPQMGGTWTIDPTSLIELHGNGAQVLRSSSTSKVYGNLIFSGSGTKTLANNVANIAGSVTIKDLAILDAQANSFGGTTTNFTMSGGRFRTSRSGTQPLMNGTYTLTGGVVEFYGTTAASATQTVRGGKTYFTIEISADEANTTTYNVLHGAGMVTVAGEFRINAPAVYQIAGSNNYIVGATASAGSFVMQPGSTLKYGDRYGITTQACGTTAACGNIRTPLRQFPESASYGVIGTSTNMVTGSGLPASVSNFYLDRSNTNLVTLTNPLTIANALVFRNGKLKTADNSPVQFTDNAISSGASAASYVSGPVSKTGTSAFTFPIGNDTYFAPAGVLETETENTVLAQYIGQTSAAAITQSPSNILSSPLYELGRNECWKISRLAGTAPMEVALTWETSRSGDITNPENLVVARLTNTSYWISEGVAEQDPATPTNQITASRKSNSFGYFALGLADPTLGFTTLPVELASFSARLQNQTAHLSWVTATEKDNAYFEVERSSDGTMYQPVGRVVSKGNSSYTQTYSFTDPELVTGQVYYRLRQTDLDGSTTFSKPVVVKYGNVQAFQLMAYPNPAYDLINVQYCNQESGVVAVKVLTVGGQVVSRKESYAGKGSVTIPVSLSGLLPRIYLLEINCATGKEVIRIEKF